MPTRKTRSPSRRMLTLLSLSLACSGSYAQLSDSDADGIPDIWEQAYGLDELTNDANEDFDADGVANIAEYNNGTHPHEHDSDFDGVDDLTDLYPTDATKALDSDLDSLPDAWEIVRGFNAFDAGDASVDYDQDGLTLAEEYLLGTDDKKEDSDRDGVLDLEDFFPTLFQYASDSDADGLPDAYEEKHFFLLSTDASDASQDYDSDGLSNLAEYLIGSDPVNYDSDKDHVEDGEDPSPLNPAYSRDSDQDGMPDEWEQRYFLAPHTDDRFYDYDGDSLTNIQEYQRGTNPNHHDSDNDGREDGRDHYPLNPIYQQDGDRDGIPERYETEHGLNDNDITDGASDFDGDSLSNSAEFMAGTQYLLPDTDFDSVSDGEDLFPLDHTKALDSDRDGLPDSFEIINGYDPYFADDASNDTDSDGLTLLQEYRQGSDDRKADTDQDYIDDKEDSFPLDTRYQLDSDSDGLPNRLEDRYFFLDPFYAQDASDDFDGDNLNNRQEFLLGTALDNVDSDGDYVQDNDDFAPLDPNYSFDTDADGMPDRWESQKGLSYDINDGFEDRDHDYLTNLQEFLLGTDPNLVDTDIDGYNDREDHYPLNPRYFRDGDRDGLPETYENIVGLNPDNMFDGALDRDGDGLNNSREFAAGTDINIEDTDYDSVPDGEDLFPLDPSIALDSDNDGIPDAIEKLKLYDPQSPYEIYDDIDGDGLSRSEEYQQGTEDNNPDSDGDGVNDREDRFPADARYQNDSDKDGLPDRFEESYDFLEPGYSYVLDAQQDHDNDQLSNLEEFILGTIIDYADSDNDGVIDGEDPAPLNPAYRYDDDHDGMPDEWETIHDLDTNRDDSLDDHDHDWQTNIREYQRGTNPNLRDSDNDGNDDYQDRYPLDPRYTRDFDRDTLPDEWEEQYGLDAVNTYDATEDPDNDGFTNMEEFERGSNPVASVEVYTLNTSTFTPDEVRSTVIDFNTYTTGAYGLPGNQDDASSGDVQVEDNGMTLSLSGNRWRMINLPYTVTANTRIAFDIQVANEGEIHGLGFDTDLRQEPGKTLRVAGSQGWGTRAGTYTGAGDYQRFELNVGDYYTGDMNYLFFVCDDDSAANGLVRYRNVVIYEAGAQPGEAYFDVPAGTTWSSLAQSLYGNPKVSHHLQTTLEASLDLSEGGRILVSEVPSELSTNQLPEIAILSPNNNGVFPEGASISFRASAEDFEDGNISGKVQWFSSIDGNLGQDEHLETNSLSSGIHTITAAITDDNQGRSSVDLTLIVGSNDGDLSAPLNLTALTPGDIPRTSVDFNLLPNSSYAFSGPPVGQVSVEDNGQTLSITGNQWRKVDLPYTVTPNTRIAFDMQVTSEGEIYAIGFDTDLRQQTSSTLRIAGTQNWGVNAGTYINTGGFQHFELDIGSYYTGDMNYLFFVCDDDANLNGAVRYRNVEVYESDTLPEEDFYLVPANATWFDLAVGLYGTHLVEWPLRASLENTYNLTEGERIPLSDLPSELSFNSGP